MGEEEEVFFGSLAGVALLIYAVPVVLGESLLSSNCRIFFFCMTFLKRLNWQILSGTVNFKYLQ